MNAFREIGVMADRINLPRKIVVSDCYNINFLCLIITIVIKYSLGVHVP